MRPLRWTAALLSALSLALGSAHAADFYQGKTLKILVGYSPGGGYDIYARLVARHLGRHIPGNPAIVVVNLPGASSLLSLRYLDSTAPKDGTVIDAFDSAQIDNSRLTPELVRVDFRKFNWIGSVSENLSVCYAWHTLGVTNLAQLKAHGAVHIGRTSPGSSADIEQKILKHIFKINVQSVAGYAGSAESELAVERGELDGGCNNWSSLPASWISGNKIRPLLRLSGGTAPDLPAGVPNALDIAPSERERAIIRQLTASGAIGKPFVASLGVPADRVKILRDGFVATMKDPLFLADAKKLRSPVSPKTAEEAVAIVNGIYAAPADIVAAAKTIATTE
jgi:tripartite-type tricarboxylate transporter receptor subunit TctC